MEGGSRPAWSGMFEAICEGGSREEAHATDRRKTVLAAADDGGVSGNMPPRPLGRIMIVSEGGDRGGGHDVSILAASALKLRGCAPRANVSTTLMRPPQQGHIWAIANASARSALAASATPMPASPNGCGASSALASSSRRWAMLAARRGAGEQAVMANAVEAVGQDVHQKWRMNSSTGSVMALIHVRRAPRRGRDNPSSGR